VGAAGFRKRKGGKKEYGSDAMWEGRGVLTPSLAFPSCLVLAKRPKYGKKRSLANELKQAGNAKGSEN